MDKTMIRNIDVLHTSLTPDGELIDNFAIVDYLLKRIDELEAELKAQYGVNHRLYSSIEELEGDVTHLTSCQSELIRQREELQAEVEELEGLCAITGVIEREKKYIAAEAEVEGLKKQLKDALHLLFNSEGE